MKRLSPFFVSALMSCSAAAAPIGDGLAGVYGLRSDSRGRTLEMVLDCSSDTAFRLVTTFSSDDQMTKDVRRLKVTVVEDASLAKQALKHAIDWRDRPIANERLAVAMQDVRPLLRANTDIDRCWDRELHGAWLFACLPAEEHTGAPHRSVPVRRVNESLRRGVLPIPDRAADEAH